MREIIRAPAGGVQSFDACTYHSLLGEELSADILFFFLIGNKLKYVEFYKNS